MPRVSKKVQKKSKGLSKPLLLGSLKVDLSGVDDHYSLLEHLRKECVRQKWCKSEEFWDMIQEHITWCPKKFLYPCYREEKGEY